MRRMMGMATGGLLVMAMGVSVVDAQALNSVPDNAVVFVRVKNLQEASKKIGGLMQDWGVAAMQPALADPLAAIEGMGNLQQGVNRGGEAAFVYFNPMTMQQQQQGDPYLIMLPVSDYDAFLKNFGDTQVNGGIAEVTMPMDGEQAFVSKWGGFAALSPNRQLVAQRPQATKVTGLTGKQLIDRDVAAYVNFNGFRDQVAGLIGFGRMSAIGQMDQQNPNANPQQTKFIPVAKAAMNQVFNGVEHFVNETQAITFGADFAPEGVKITMMTEFMPDSYLGKLASQWKSPESKLGAGLPEGPYAMVGTMATDRATLIQVVDDAAGPVLAEARKLGPDAKPILDYVDAMREIWSATKVQSFGVSAGQGEPGETPLFDMVVTVKGDAKKIVDAQTRMAVLQNEFTKMVQMQGQPTSSIEVQKAAKVVDGVSFDQMVTKFEGGDAANMQNVQMMEMIYGKGGFTMLLGQVDENTVVGTTSKEDAALKAAVAAAKLDKSMVADQAITKQVAGQLPQNPIFSFFFYGDRFMGIISRASEAFAGTPVQMQLPAGTAPLGMSASTEGSAVRVDLYVPSPLVKEVMKVALEQGVKQEQQRDQGGGL